MSTRRAQLALPLRLLIYLALAIALWVKFRASYVIQLRIVTTIFLTALLAANYYCLRLLRERLRHPIRVQTRLVARSTGTYVLVIGYLAFAIGDVGVLIGLARLLRGGGVEDNTVAAAWLGSFIGMLFIWAGSYELRLLGDEIEYFSFAVGYRSLRLRDIDSAKILVGWETYSDRFRPTSRLEIVPSSHALPSVFVNLKVFRKENLDIVFDWLGEKLAKK